MIGQILFVLTVAAVSAEAAAQAASANQEAAASPSAKVPVLRHRSVFEGYRPYKETEAGRWREANEEVGRLGGHVGHVKSDAKAQSGSRPASAPDQDHAGHGGRK